ncbi:dolichyl-phosphate-mannose--protein mannosyltransferase [Thermococcus stetteri]|uniref:dolichyl-phosphate-mannose--protein mannosyltransferase n=1 Tax=Thermococcus stetteri TaxID=49900 RepID=UPI001FD7F5A6|nr:dolichyl-phosphate-mannose--protein mannosyltransferase [Thermococcus stetteri]MBP1910831.1 putative membrane-bound dolichyl-phosphate-mannose-protein mannosyltransferase [Thermococcus stetteri]
MDREKIIRVVFVAVVALTMIGTIWYSYSFASRPDLKDYIGDEVWYVPATRNILHRLGVNVFYVNNGSYGVNVVFSNTSVKMEYISIADWAASLSGAKYRREYMNFPGVYYEIPAENYKGFIKRLESDLPEGSYDVIPGFPYPDKENIHKYLNTEHPFMGKDLIMISMVLLGDKPISWRIPGIIEFALIELVVVLVTYRVSRSYMASLIALLFIAADPTLQATAVTAMLDIHVAFFVALFVLAVVYGRELLSAVLLGLAGATKLSGAFGWPVHLWKCLKSENSFPKFFTKVAIIPGVVFLVPELPAIKAIGFEEWLREFLGSFKWHLSYKGPNPNTSPFWQWFIDYRPFPFHFNPNVFASTDPVLLMGMVVMILALPWVHRKKPRVSEPFFIFWSTVGLFALQYLLGGKTQFSFYATVLVPPAAVSMGVFVNEIIKWEAFKESLGFYTTKIQEVIRSSSRRFMPSENSDQE